MLLPAHTIARLGTPPNAAHGTIAAQANAYNEEEPCGGDIIGWPNGNVCCNLWCRVCEEEDCRRRGLREVYLGLLSILPSRATLLQLDMQLELTHLHHRECLAYKFTLLDVD